jgi:phage terminase large subunit-like protein
LSASIASGRLSEVLNELNPVELEFIAHDWELWARDDQLPPAHLVIPGEPQPELSSRPQRSGEPGPRATSTDVEDTSGSRVSQVGSPGMTMQGMPWRVWLVLGGRGSGKTRAGAEWVRSLALAPSDSRSASRLLGAENRIALVGKTLADVRNVMVEGISGLLAIHPARERPEFEPSKRRLTWPNGAIAELFSADEAEALRGPQFTAAWCDELAKWRGAERAWDMLQFGLRLGDAPRACVTTTPRATKLLKQIIADETTVTVNLATADNATNLAPTFLAEMTRRYAGSARAAAPTVPTRSSGRSPICF